eukprot:gene5047-5541_t
MSEFNNYNNNAHSAQFQSANNYGPASQNFNNNYSNKSFPNFNNSAGNNNARDRVVADKRILSAAFLETAPESVREWTIDTVSSWLKEIFEGAEDLPRYQAAFAKFGIKGIDLLGANEQVLHDLGISHPVHLNRARIALDQLVVYQNELDVKEKDKAKLYETEKNYHDLLDEAKRLKLLNPSYALPRKIDYWKPVDVMLWLNSPNNTTASLGLFAKPFALKRINGPELLEMVSKKGDKTTVEAVLDEVCRSMAEKDKPTSVDIQRLKKAIEDKKAYYEDFERKINQEKTDEMKANVFQVKESEIREQRNIGKGNFGVVTEAMYRNQRVAIKRLKTNVLPKGVKERKGEDGATPNINNSSGEQKQETKEEEALKKQDNVTKNRSKGVVTHHIDVSSSNEELSKKEEALKHEAYMMYRCADTSVVRLLAQGEFNNSGRFFIVMELVNGSNLEQEYRLATKPGGEMSIFHPNHSENLRLQSEGIEDPVFYQIVRIGRDVALALAKIHQRGIIHLDIAARNILLDRIKGKVKITDFGLAQEEKEMIEDSRLRFEVSNNIDTNHMDKSEVDHFIQWSRNKGLGRTGEKSNMYKEEAFNGEIPHKWRPIWNLRMDSNPEIPKIDRHCDIYAYGCCLYEMLTKQYPFHEFSKTQEDLWKLLEAKESVDSHPRLPDNLHPGFAGVIKRCWGTYKNQPEMKDVYVELAQLHKTISRGVILSQRNEEAYENLKEFFVVKRETSPYMRGTVYDGTAHQYSLAGNGYSSSGVGASNTNYSIPMKAQYQLSSYSGDLNSKSSGSIASAATESRGIDIRSESAENDGKGQNQYLAVQALLSPFISIKMHGDASSPPGDYYTAQNSKQGLLNILDNAFQSQDCLTIADTLAMVTVGNSNDQLDVIERCLELLNKYASDCHNTIMVEEIWLYLSKKVADKIQETIDLINNKEVVVDSIASRCSILIEKAFKTLSRILKFKHWSNKRVTTKDKYKNNVEVDETDEELLWCKEIALVATSALGMFNSNASIVSSCIEALNDAADDSEQIIETLHDKGVVQKLIACGRKFMSNGEVVKSVFKALKAFSLRQILQPDGSLLIPQNSSPPISHDLLDQSWSAYRRLAFDVMRFYAQSNSSEDIEVTNHVLHCLWKIVRCGMYDTYSTWEEEEEKFFLSLTTDDITWILDIIKSNSDCFEVLESAIGILSVILETGVASPVLSQEVIEFSHKLDRSQRIQLFMTTEDNIKSILSAMERFSVDDQITIGIERKAPSPEQRQYQSKGALFSNHRSSSYSSAYGKQSYYAASSPYSPTPTNQQKEGSYYSDRNGADTTVYSSGKVSAYDDEIQSSIFTADGRITAGDLQRNAINVISIISSESKDKVIQQNLERTRYSELILQAFQNFKNDPLLIHNGLQALFHASRKNARHQARLHDLSITKHLKAALRRFLFLDFGSSWRSILVLEGVLGAFLGLLDPEDDQPFSPQAISRDVATWTKAYSTVNANSPKHKQCKDLAHMLCHEEAEEIETIAFYVIYLSLNDDPEASMYVRLLFIRLLSILNFWSPLNIKGSFVHVEFVLLGRRHELDYSLYRFLINLLKVERAPEAIASGLSLLVEINRASQEVKYDTIFLGKEVSSISLRPVDDDDKEQAIEDGSDLLKLCLISCKRKLDNVLLIRYSLWVMILMIIGEDKKDENNKTVSKVALVENREAASEIALANGIEWSIEVLTSFTDCYSLQSLSLLFLIWMERRGHFAKRLERLESLREILVGIVTNQWAPKYRSLEEEGYDTSLVGRTIYMFGDVPTHADRLLKLVEKHLADASASSARGFNDAEEKKATAENSKVPWDGKKRPQVLTVKRYEAQQNGESGKTSNVYVIEITWELVLIDPVKCVVRPTVWEVRKRFPECVKFQKELMKLFAFCPSLFNKVLTITVLDQVTRFFMNRSPEFLDGRKQILQNMLNELQTVPAVHSSAFFQHFIEVEQFVGVGNVRKLHQLPPILTNQNRVSLPVNSVCMDQDEKLLFVGCGLGYSFLQNASFNVIRGSLTVYKVHPDKTPIHVECCSMQFCYGVNSVAWDSYRRCLAVGLTTGLIGYYQLSEDCSTLTYAGELEYHQDNIIGMEMAIVDLKRLEGYVQQYLHIAVSRGGRATMVDMECGAQTFQLAKAGCQIVSMAFDFIDQVAYFGTDVGRVMVFNTEENNTNLLFEIPIMHDVKGIDPKENARNGRGDVHVAYCPYQHLLYVCHHNKIFIYKSSPKRSSDKQTEAKKPLTFADDTFITAARLIHYGRLLVVTCNNGRVLLIDMSETVRMFNRPKRPASDTAQDVAEEARIQMAEKEREIATSLASAMNWSEAVKSKESVIRDWLSNKGEAVSNIVSHSGLVRALVNQAKIPLMDLADTVCPKEPNCEVLFFQAYSSAKEGVRNVNFRDICLCEVMQVLFFAGDDGYLYTLSLRDFYEPFTGIDTSNFFRQKFSPGREIKTATQTNKMTRYQK